MKPTKQYQSLLSEIAETLTTSKERAFAAVNSEMLQAYWHIGKYIAEYELQGKEKADYGSHLYKKLADDLTLRVGKGFSRSLLYYMKQFYDTYPIVQSLIGRLTWTHYVMLLGISDPLSRRFYEKQAEIEHWSVRELKRQIRLQSIKIANDCQ